MQRLLSVLLSLIGSLFLFFSAPSHAQNTMNALVLYDAPAGEYEKLGLAYAIMLKNLLGHFNGAVVEMPVQNYVAGQTENYTTIFYLGSHYDNPLPPAFLQDVAATTKTVVWFRYNIWQLAWNAAYGFNAKTGLNFTDLRGLNAAPSAGRPAPGFFDTVLYKNKEFVKYYKYNDNSGLISADPDVGVMQIADPLKASSLVSIRNATTAEQIPYVVRGNNFWYVADMPLSYIGPRDRYLVLADVLHDMLAIDHPESHRGMIRLEDVDALVSVHNMKRLGDYLHKQQIPFSVSAIPLYKDPLGVHNDGVPRTIALAQAADLQQALNYALTRGGEILQHGYTHQYSNIPNANSGITGDDFEFWDAVHNSPLPEDSLAFAADRIQAGRNDLQAAGYAPVAFEFPHYQASALSMKAVPPIYAKTYQRAVYYTADTPNFTAAQGKDYLAGQFFPYVIQQDHYGQKVLPENLGNFEYDLSALYPGPVIVYTWQDIYTNAQYAMTVRDGFGSFFFHPYMLDPDLPISALQDLRDLVAGMKALGYTWTSPSALP